MFFGQPSVPALPGHLSFASKTVLVTGANTGLGYAVSLHVLQRGAAKLVMGVRSVEKGEVAKQQLLDDAIVKARNPLPEIVLLQLDMASESSVIAFANQIVEVDVAILNAGVYQFEWQLAEETKREMTFQVNYVSTVLLGILLLPKLHASGKPRSPSHLCFVGSEQAVAASLPVSAGQSVFEAMGDRGRYKMMERYSESKLLLALFVRSAATHLNAEQVVVTNVCPGAVVTDLARGAPGYLKAIVPLFQLVKGARTPEVGARLIVLAAAAGKEVHGQLVTNGRPAKLKLLSSKDGEAVSKKLWEETFELAEQLVPGSVKAAKESRVSTV